MRERIYSAHYDFKTGFLSTLSGLIGVALLVVYLNESYGISLLSLSSSTLGILLAFSIIFIGLSSLFYLLHYLFRKLGEIVEELEEE